MYKSFPIQIRFSDLDWYGHVNNANYLSYFEMARVHFFNELLGENWNWREKGFLLIKNEIEYLKPLLLNQQPIVFIKPDQLGNKSFTLNYKIEVDQQLTTIGTSTQVCFNTDKSESIEIPLEMKQALINFKNS